MIRAMPASFLFPLCFSHLRVPRTHTAGVATWLDPYYVCDGFVATGPRGGPRGCLLSYFPRVLRACEMQMARVAGFVSSLLLHVLLLYQHSARW
ncbi:hypothetical protein B0H13DRAFT_2059947, partial [Mycena leptocephala]